MAEGTRTGKVATVREDGRAHVVPVWFVFDDDGSIVFTTFHTTVKARAVARDPRVTLCVDDQTPPYSFVMVEGRVTISDDRDELRRCASRIGARYMGEDEAEAFGERNAVEGELVVRMTPTHVVAKADMAA